VGLFDPQSVKALKEKAQFFGGLVGDVTLGRLAPEHMHAMVESEDQRAELRILFDAAARDVGPDRALKAAIKSARMPVERACDMNKLPRRPAVDSAEDIVRSMLNS